MLVKYVKESIERIFTMATYDALIDPTAEWADVQQLSTTALLRGGLGGPLNQQALELAARSKWLRDRLTPTVQEFTATAGQTIFTLSSAPLAKNATRVHINGVYQHKSTYSLTGSTLTLSSGVTVGHLVEVEYTVA